MPKSIEDKVRSSLGLIRFMQTSLPIPFASRILKRSMDHVSFGSSFRREKISADGVRCEWIISEGAQTDRVLFYLHGGGFVFGLTPQHLPMAAYLGQKIGARALIVDYRLAPDHPFPAALDDCVSAYRWLLEQGISAKNIVIAGDSAGGNLALTSMIKLRDDGIALPAAAACLSPVTNLAEKHNPNGNFKAPLLPKKAMKYYTESYVRVHDARDPLISPVFGELGGLPPMLVHVGEDEVLREDAVQLVARAKECGVDATLKVYPRMWHVWQLFMQLPQAKQSLDDIAQFLLSHLDGIKQN